MRRTAAFHLVLPSVECQSRRRTTILLYFSRDVIDDRLDVLINGGKILKHCSFGVIYPDLRREGHYKMMGSVRLFFCLTVERTLTERS